MNDQLIIKLTCNHYGKTVEEVMRPSSEMGSRKSHIVFVRQAAMKLVKVYTSLSLESIADLFNRDHSTVLHAIKSIQDRIDTDWIFKESFDSLETKIKIIKHTEAMSKEIEITMQSERHQLENKRQDLIVLRAQPIMFRKVSIIEIDNLLYEVNERLAEIERYLNNPVYNLDQAS